MPVPTVSITKLDYQTGVVPPNPTGILAVLAEAGAGPQNVPQGFQRDTDVLSTFSPGRLAEDCSYILGVGGNPIIAQRPTTSVAGGYNAIDTSGSPTGTSVPTAGAATPVDNYDVIVTWMTGGTIGGAGITYTFSLDGGLTTSAPQALPTGAAPIILTIPNFSAGGSPGVSFSLAAGTVVAGEFFRDLVKAPQMNDTDLSTALTALGNSTLGYEGILIDMDIASTTPGVVDAFLAGLETKGKFKYALLNTRMKGQLHVGTGTAETESAFATAMTTLMATAASSIRLCIGTDGGTIPSTLTGRTLPRPTSLALAARAARIPLGEDPGYVARGPLSNVTIVDTNGNPAYHNEELFPNLDQLGLTTLRSVVGQRGAYITNANVESPSGSDFHFLQHVRIMNRACEIAFAQLVVQLGRGVGKKPKDPTTGLIYILEADAQVIESSVNQVLQATLGTQVNGVTFRLSRTDDLTSNAGATLTGYIQIQALAYVKKFSVTAAFAKSLTPGN